MQCLPGFLDDKCAKSQESPGFVGEKENWPYSLMVFRLRDLRYCRDSISSSSTPTLLD